MSDSRVLVSVIIPVYNVESFIEKCLDSVCAQTYTNLEILLIDDGSTDHSSLICDLYSERDCRIKVIHQKNGGLSLARNVGMETSSGEYVIFVDSDDYIETTMIEKMYSALVGDNAELCVCNFDYVYSDGSYSDENPLEYPIRNEVIFAKDIFNDKFFQPHANYWAVAWNKMYSRQLINKLQFPVGKIYEDLFIAHETYSICNRVSCIDDVLYHHVVRENSITHSSLSIQKRMDHVEALSARLMYYSTIPDLKYRTLEILRLITFEYREIKSSNILIKAEQTKLIKCRCSKVCLDLLKYKSAFEIKERMFLIITCFNIDGWNTLAKLKERVKR